MALAKKKKKKKKKRKKKGKSVERYRSSFARVDIPTGYNSLEVSSSISKAASLAIILRLEKWIACVQRVMTSLCSR